MDHRNAKLDSHVVEEVARLKIIGAIDDEIVVLDDLFGVLRSHAQLMADDLYIRVEPLDGDGCALHLGHADAIG